MMKFPKEVNENESDLKRNTEKSNANIGTKTLQENNRIILEDDDPPSGAIEPNTTALIPPWIRNTLGLSEKGSQSNQKCFKTIRASGDRGFSGEKGEMKSDPDDVCVKTNFCLRESSSNAVIEVNIGNEADFPEEASDVREKVSSVWKGRVGKQNQYDCNIFGISKDNRMTRSLKSEVTSIDVVVPVEDMEDEKHRVRMHKTKNKTYKKVSGGGLKNDEVYKSDPDAMCRTNAREVAPKTDFGMLGSNGIKQLDARLLLLCGKNTVNNLTEDDISLLQEMKNQLGHKEGFEKLFSEIRESAFPDRNTNKEMMEGKKDGTEKKDERDANEKFRKERTKESTKTESDCNPHVKDFFAKTDESDMRMLNHILNKSKAMEEERRYLEEIKKYYEKKKSNPHRSMKCSEEVEMEKEKKCRILPQKIGADKERKSKWRHSDVSAIEKAVSEILQKFIEFYRFQVPPDIVTSMKKSIIQSLQSEYSEAGAKKNLDALLAAQEGLKNTEAEKSGMHSHLIEKREDNTKDSARKTHETAFKKRAETNTEENFVVKDLPIDTEDMKTPFRTLITSIEKKKFGKENDVGEDHNLKALKNDFDKCLKSIQAQLDLTGAKLCSIILEKVEVEDASNKKLKIIHDFPTGITDSLKIYNEKLNIGSPEGDNTSVKVCHCNTIFAIKSNCSQSTQTKDKELAKSGTQTDCTDLSIATDLAPGLYRIIKTSELGSFYICPEVIEEVVEDKRVVFESCELPENDALDKNRDDLLKSVSRDTFISEKIHSVNSHKRLRRAFKSDCLGLNKIDLEELIREDSKISLLNLLSENLAAERQELPVSLEEESIPGKGIEPDDRDIVKSESYHVGCVLLWNGKRMDPGVDLKVHVEDLLREKLREILTEVRVKEDSKSCETEEDKRKSEFLVDVGTDMMRNRSSEKNLEIRKTHGKFCITNNNPLSTDLTPFIFSGCNKEEHNFKMQIHAEDKALQRLNIDNFVRSVREVGTQNSQHTFISLNLAKLRPRSKLCTVAKFTKQKPRKYISSPKSRCERPRTSCAKALSFAENVGEAKKVKLEFRESNELALNRDKRSNEGNLHECFSAISNGSSSSTEGPVRVKLIGIEVSKEKKLSDEQDFYESSGKETKKHTSEEERGNSREPPKKYKHWELIENVLNRVNQKEKDSLWDDIREFVKKKIGRDINDEGAREVCIEIEQDVPKFCKGKSNQTVVAKGNYTRNEGDVEVEVDLTLDDLERILRHRQKKLRRRHNFHKMKVDSKNSFTSSGTSSDGTLNYTSNCSVFGGNGYANCSKMSKDEN